MTTNAKRSHNEQRHDFLLTFFEDEKEEIKKRHFERSKEVNGYMLVKYFSGDTQRWQVNIMTKESYRKMIQYRQQSKELEQQQSFLSSI